MAAPRSTNDAAQSTHTERSDVLVERLFSRIGEVSSLPAVAMKIIEVANNPGSSALDLLEVIERDVALAMRIMRIVNSSYYALKNKVADLQLAITLLGFEQIRNLALTSYIAQLFESSPGHGKYRREGLWNHLIGVGTVARLIAETCGKVPPREAYLAGLLHDVGLILVDQYLHKPFCQVVDALADNVPVCAVEKQVLGFNHAELGGYVAEKWDLPEHLTTAIRYHHVPQKYEGPHSDMVYVVALANSFCSAKGLTSLGARDLKRPPNEIFAGLGLNQQQVTEIWDQLDEILKAADIMAVARLVKR